MSTEITYMTESVILSHLSHSLYLLKGNLPQVSGVPKMPFI